MTEEHYAPVCGIYCRSCKFLGNKCEGSGKVNGVPFWVESMPSGICPVYDCCRNEKHLEHCGLCDEFPCKAFLELRDPAMSDEEFRESLEERSGSLRRRAEIGTLQWLFEQAKKGRPGASGSE